MLDRAILDINLKHVRQLTIKKNKTHMPRVQRAASPLVVILGKREVWREKTRFIEKNGFSLSTSLPAFSKLYSSQSLGKNKFNQNI